MRFFQFTQARTFIPWQKRDRCRVRITSSDDGPQVRRRHGVGHDLDPHKKVMPRPHFTDGRQSRRSVHPRQAANRRRVFSGFAIDVVAVRVRWVVVGADPLVRIVLDWNTASSQGVPEEVIMLGGGGSVPLLSSLLVR